MKERIDQLILPQSAKLLLAESPFVQESPKQLREPRIATVILAVDPFTAFDHVIFQIPQIRQLLNRVGHLLCFLNHSVKLTTQSSVEGCAGKWPFLTSTKSVRSGWNRRLASTGCSSACPPSRHSMPLHGAVSTGVDPFTMADSTFTSRGCTSNLNLNRSFTGLPRFCLQPRYRSVVCTEACPSKN